MKYVKGHNECKGYSWKNCPGDTWNYREAIAGRGLNIEPNKNTPYLVIVIVPNVAFWQARSLVSKYEKKGFKCEGVAFKTYGPNEKPADNDPYKFVIDTDLENAKKLVIDLHHKGYSKAFGQAK